MRFILCVYLLQNETHNMSLGDDDIVNGMSDMNSIMRGELSAPMLDGVGATVEIGTSNASSNVEQATSVSLFSTAFEITNVYY